MDAGERIRGLHAEVDAVAADLARRHAGRLRCGRGCASCCVDDLSVFEVEAERIRTRHGELLSHGAPHPAGACAFLDEAGACRIYEDRPYVCRSQGLPLRWIESASAAGEAPAGAAGEAPAGAAGEAPAGAEGAVVERRDICPLNEPGPPLEELAADDCFTLGPFEGRLAALEAEQGRRRRVRLRDLFEQRG